MPGDLMFEMRGPKAVRQAITDFLAAELPVRVPSARTVWGLAEEQLPVPDPEAFYAQAPEDLDRWPLVAVTSGRMSQRGIDSDDGDPQYRASYPVRVYVWVRAEGYQLAADQRDDYATVIRSALLSRLHLGTGGWLLLVTSSLVADFSEITKVKGDRYVAGAYVGFDVHATETLTDRLATPNAPSRDTVSTVSIAGTVLPPHPALS